ncbi:hypothetical protein KZ779_07720 [Escherichia coli]|nr:hypothetical protein [Escherichia coli]
MEHRGVWLVSACEWWKNSSSAMSIRIAHLLDDAHPSSASSKVWPIV